MFGSEKVFDRPKKAKKRHGLAFFVIGTFTFAIESMLGINAAFLIDQSIAIVAFNMLAGTVLAGFAPIITLVVALAVGFCFIFGGMWTFSGFMDSLDDAKAYKRKFHTNNWPVAMVWALMVAVVCLDFTTLMFRAAFFAEKGAMALFAFFVILIFLPPILGPLIHVLENTPHDRQMAKVRVQAEHRHTANLAQVANEIDDDLLEDLISGDEQRSQSAISEHYRRQDARAQERYEGKLEKQEDRRQGEDEKNRPLSIAPQKKQA